MKQKQMARTEKEKSKRKPAAAGLTFQERFRLYRDKKALSRNSSKLERPNTSPKSIPFQRMYPDGICQVTGRYYTKMVEFYDLNYSLLEAEDQKDIRTLYREFLDYFDQNIGVQLFLFNRRVNDKVLDEQFQMDIGEDEYSDIRKEQVNFLRHQAAAANNGIVESKYVIFGMECLDIQDARIKLNNVEKDVIKNLENIGTIAHGLDGKERLRVLHEFFHQDTMEPFHFSWKEMKETGATARDVVAPSSFDFRFQKSFKTGGMHGTACYLKITAAKFSDELLKNLLEIEGNISISIHIQTLNIMQARKKLSAALSNVQSSKIDAQKEAFHGGYDPDILSPEILANEQGIKKWLDDCNTSNRKMIRTTFLITCFGRTKQERDTLKQRISGVVEISGNNLTELDMRQEQGLMATAPIGINEIDIGRPLDTQSISALVPFCTQELFMQGEALYVGLNKLSNNLIIADRKRLRNPNGVILGTPGSGKSFSAKMEILLVFLMTRDDILICDVENEYRSLVEELHGQIINLSGSSKDYLNPMDILYNRKTIKDALRAKADFLITLVDLIAGESRKLESDEKGIVDECITKIYRRFLANPVPENMPILQDLYDELLKHPNEKAERIANCLYLYVHGSQNYFNHRTNIDTSNRVVCFNIQDLADNLKDLGMLIVQDAVWNRVYMNKYRGIATRYYCDEFHKLLRESRTAAYMVEIWKRFRKWGGIPTALTQNVGDFLRTHDIESILGNSDYVLLLNMNAYDQNIVMEKFDLSRKQLEHITNAPQGSGLLIFDSITIPFVNNYPKNTRSYQIMSTRPNEDLELEDELPNLYRLEETG